MADTTTTTAGPPIARVLPLLSPAHLDRDFDYLVPPEFDEIAQPGVRVRLRFAGRLVDGYLLERLEKSEHTGKLVKLERVVSPERVLTPEILRLAVAVAARYAGTRADVLRLAIPPRHAGAETGKKPKAGKKAAAAAPVNLDADDAGDAAEPTESRGAAADFGGAEAHSGLPARSTWAAKPESAGRPESSASGVGQEPAGRPENASGVGQEPAGRPDSASGVRQEPVGRPDSVSGVRQEPVGRPDSVSGVRQEPVGRPESASGVRHEPAGRPDSALEARHEPASMSETGPERVAAQPSGDPEQPTLAAIDPAAWSRYAHGEAFVSALSRGKGVRAAWQALPGEDWAARLAELAATVVATGRTALLLVPDQRDLDRLLAECVRLVGDSAVGLSAGLGPSARYRRWLSVLRGTARIVVGTRAAVFAPARDLGLIAIWDDGDDTYAEPRAPYPHAREVAMLRAHESGVAFVAAGFARTAEIQAVVDSGWAHDLVADRDVLRAATPRISAPGDSDWALERDPIANAIRIPGIAFAAARAALKEGAAVLVQVPRRGYVPALSCAKCRTPARCRHCNGPLALPQGPRADEAHSPSCRWCGIVEAAYRCPACASRALRAVVIGAVRTAEELGRAFPGVPIRGSGGGTVLDTLEPGPQVVVATVGAEPLIRGGYAVALLLDGWALLGRADLRAAEDALRRWMAAAALVRARGQVIVMAEPAVPTVQALIRWDPIGHARLEVEGRTEVGFPPAVRLAAVDGTTESIAELLSNAELPDDVQVLGPVPLPPGARKPFSSGDDPAEVERMLLRVHRRSGAALAKALTTAQAVRSTHRSEAPLRVQIDPIDIG
ncbi:primosomal protein N' family DNA-binding protein [Nocardia goodfellowii]|uniref:primosomal protein N' family DNA-binding protein n=1 Tax=Nocardia goodfellowii TaxID=882446 RepID=UPI0027DC44A4|nr:primosomal protein N' [Nocardia goodfellowii]